MNQKGWKGFIQLCLSANDEKTLSSTLDFFLTPEEKQSIALRYLIIQELLKQEKTQREMATDLQVSIAKITRGSNELKRIPLKLHNFLKKCLLDN